MRLDPSPCRLLRAWPASLAGLYSLVATCESRDIHPFDYRSDVLARAQDQPANATAELLPAAWAAVRGYTIRPRASRRRSLDGYGVRVQAGVSVEYARAIGRERGVRACNRA